MLDNYTVFLLSECIYMVTILRMLSYVKFSNTFQHFRLLGFYTYFGRVSRHHKKEFLDNYAQGVLKSTTSNLFSPFYGVRELLNKSWFSYILETTKNHHFLIFLRCVKTIGFYRLLDTIKRKNFLLIKQHDYNERGGIIYKLTHTFTEPKVFYIFTVLRGAVLPVKLPLASVLGQLGPSLSGLKHD